ncbi:hypothetical protein BDP27DRAFT_1408052 [Rhodocollybia butyracea]|uniref:Uncharacterized protein n=1 Tax=Rhodocollybia butyracea TaxID=206335 RepID=A0A9P5P8P4_9AGAR|nr:hypothetical protein BDP27DRAFT_1408052 [Rhodocollybia butyracea]
MSSSPNNVDMLAEVLTQDILPKASSLILWILVFITVFMAILQRVLFPCVTLSRLRRTVDAVDELLDGHETGIHTMHTSIVSDGCVDCTDCLRRCIDYKQSWLWIDKVAHKIYDRDRNSSWAIYLSLTRHSIALSSKQHNEWKLDSVTQLRRHDLGSVQVFVAFAAFAASDITDSSSHGPVILQPLYPSHYCWHSQFSDTSALPSEIIRLKLINGDTPRLLITDLSFNWSDKGTVCLQRGWGGF